MTFSSLYSKILVVDDEKEVRESLKLFLEEEQFTVQVANDGEDALMKVSDFQPHCVLLDIRMPYLNGVEALKMIKHRQPNTEIIMVSAINNVQMAEECLKNGAFGYLSKPIDLKKLLTEIKACLDQRRENLKEHRNKQKGDYDKTKLEAKTHFLNKELFHALRFPLHLFSYSDSEFATHSFNVSWLCEKIAKQIKSQHLELTNIAGLYHDIGKLCLPKYLFQKHKQDWTYEEKQIYKRFPVYGQELANFHFRLKGLGYVLRHQCENVDGTGFPDGVSGGDIPQESKIIAVANAFAEAMEIEGLNQMKLDINKADNILEYIKKDIGKLYDGAIVEALQHFVTNYKTPNEIVIETSELKPGMKLSRNLYTHSGRLIIPKNMTLDIQGISKIIDLSLIDPIEGNIYILTPENN
jgi:putative two-component system response regulator